MTRLRLPEGVTLVLASKSPRRKELLREMGLEYISMVADISETFPAMMHPREAVRFLAEKKARAVAEVAGPRAIVLASDTLVEVDGEPLGKPRDEKDASAMLWRLSGRHHNVHTGVCVVWGDKMLSETDTTDVFFHPLDQADIDAYIATGEPLDKAGAYGIQGKGGKFVSHINGHLDTVIGLPCQMVEELLLRILPNQD
ncbi:MAG: septum formation protein Maf [Clostridia bacterium]|nr:septum formation protein Maf [Clostridia bacterium]